MRNMAWIVACGLGVSVASGAGAQDAPAKPTVAVNLTSAGFEAEDSTFIVNGLRYGLGMDSLLNVVVRVAGEMPSGAGLSYLVTAIARKDGDVYSVNARVFNVGTSSIAASMNTNSVGSTLGDSVEALGRRIAKAVAGRSGVGPDSEQFARHGRGYRLQLTPVAALRQSARHEH
jgi:hypothetical protein